MSQNLVLFALFFPIFLFSLSCHECAHAWIANRQGDPTARLMGRMTLNPLPHIDPIGTILFPLMMFLLPGFVFFGWARPVPVDPRNFRHPRRDHLQVAAAGPMANLILGMICAFLCRLLTSLARDSSPLFIANQMLENGVYLNFMLAFFNLIPLHPLDGSKVLEGILPPRYLPGFERIGRYGFLILIAMLYLGILRYLSTPILYLARAFLP